MAGLAEGMQALTMASQLLAYAPAVGTAMTGLFAAGTVGTLGMGALLTTYFMQKPTERVGIEKVIETAYRYGQKMDAHDASVALAYSTRLVGAVVASMSLYWLHGSGLKHLRKHGVSRDTWLTKPFKDQKYYDPGYQEGALDFLGVPGPEAIKRTILTVMVGITAQVSTALFGLAYSRVITCSMSRQRSSSRTLITSTSLKPWRSCSSSACWARPWRT